jgi:hypothetical protein
MSSYTIISTNRLEHTHVLSVIIDKIMAGEGSTNPVLDIETSSSMGWVQSKRKD